MEELVVFKRTYEKEFAENIRVVLEEHNIEYKIKFAQNNIESTFGMQNSTQYEFYINKDSYHEASGLIANLEEQLEEDIDLNSYSDEDIRDIILNQYEWHENFIKEAKLIAVKRNIPINEKEIEEVIQKKLAKVRIGESPNKIIFFMFWLFAVMGGFLGMIVGYYYWRGTLKAFDGNRYLMYNKRTQLNGKWMFITGIFSAIIQLFYIAYV